MKNIRIFVFVVVLAACRADLDDHLTSPSSTPISNSPKRTPAEVSPTSEQQVPTPTTAMFLLSPAGQTSTSIGETSTLNEQSSALVGETSTSVSETSVSVGETSSNGPTPASSSGPTPAPVLCGPVPRNIHRCIGGPVLVKPEWGKTCSEKHTDECELMTCVFEKAGWIQNGVIEKLNISMDFTAIGKTQRKWAPAVKEALETCIWEDLPPQGVYLKCPAYDVTSCVEAAFVRNTKPSQWSSSAACQQTKQQFASCPFCPEDCFAPVVPYGSCQACLGLTRQKSLPSS